MSTPAAIRATAAYAALTASHEDLLSRINWGGPDDCWPWTGSLLVSGYGRYYSKGSVARAHRLIYEIAIGPIPEGAHLDHICHGRDESCPGGNGCQHRRCCNPTHLEPVSLVNNVMRGRSQAALNARKDRCKRGHPFTPSNTRLTPDGRRRCMACSGLTGKGIGSAESAKTSCPQGHSYDAENTKVALRPDGSFKCRICRTCARDRARASYWKKRKA
ncbi:HNH endonuclease [Streptomyces drozdowiczii]|uniref:HNH endonuclease n=1 Tax=Streptomyces drozdowiczii TaxID=202862 RepID=UPI00403D3667